MYNKKAVKLHYFAIIGIIFISANLQHFTEGVPVESDKGSDDQFIFVLPGAESGSNIYNGLPVSIDLQPPLEAKTRVAKDSYGNPVQSYETIGEVHTGKNGKKVVQANGVQFELPSYASGITGIKEPIDELLPPLTTQQTSPNHPGSSFTPNYGNNLNTGNNPQFTGTGRPTFGFENPSSFLAPSSSGSSPPSNPSILSSPSGDAFHNPQQSSAASFNNPSKINSNSNGNNDGKYSGTFGGAAGVLGDQKKPGYAVQSDGSIKDPDNAYKPTATGAIETPQSPTIPAVQNSISTGEKYVGGFGGPPGILSPFDNQKSG